MNTITFECPFNIGDRIFHPSMKLHRSFDFGTVIEIQCTKYDNNNSIYIVVTFDQDREPKTKHHVRIEDICFANQVTTNYYDKDQLINTLHGSIDWDFKAPKMIVKFPGSPIFECIFKWNMKSNGYWSIPDLIDDMYTSFDHNS